MTVTADGVVAGGSAARVSGRGPARAAAVEQLSRADRVARGKDARAVAPLESHAEFTPGRGRDPVGLLLSQAASRVPELVPVRHGRMLVSPFTFYRGAALPMAADLAGTPASGLRVQLCGDAHLSNFGAFASPERQPGLRRQRLRRDPARPVRVGRQAAGREPGRGRTGQRVPRQGRAQDRSRGGRTLPHRDARVRGRRPSWTSGTRTWTSSRSSPSSGPRSRRKGSRKPRSCWPRPTPPTARRRWAS